MNNIIIDIKSKIDQLDGDAHNIDLVTEGEWHEKNDAVFLVYYESELSGMKGSKTMLKIQDDTITMTRFGGTNSKIIFNTKEPMASVYKTPYGDFDMNVFTETLNIDLDTDTLSGSLYIRYQMILENVSRSENTMNITIRKI